MIFVRSQINPRRRLYSWNRVTNVLDENIFASTPLV